MAFTDVEMAIISQLAYCGDKESPPQPLEGEYLYSYLSNPVYRKYLDESLGEGYAEALDKLTEKSKNLNYSIVKTADDNKGTGFAAIAIKDDDNNVTVATRGTEGFNIIGSDASRRDVLSDLGLAFEISTAQQKEMEMFMLALDREGYDGYYFTGHSLGGNLANYGALTFFHKNKIKGVVTFNAPGFNEAFISLYLGQILSLKGRMTNYQNEYDYVSSLLSVPGDVVIVESSLQETGNFDFDDHLLFADHYLKPLAISGDGFTRKDIQIKSVQTYAADYVVDKLRFSAYSFVATLALSNPYVLTAIAVIAAVEIGIILGREAAIVIEKIAIFLKKQHSDGYKFAGENPLISVDTGKLRNYANRLISVNDKLKNIDQRIDSLYLKVGLRDLYALISADILTGSSKKILNCAKYLEDTADDFDTTEANIAGLF